MGACRLIDSLGYFDRVFFIFDGDCEAATITADDSGGLGTIRFTFGLLFISLKLTVVTGEGGIIE